MDKEMTNFKFELMSFMFKVRDLLNPRLDILNEIGIAPGSSMLDYGYGPGSYIPPLAELADPAGKIYALDIHPQAIKKVRGIADRKGIKNIETIQSGRDTGLAEDVIDVVLLYDVFNDLSEHLPDPYF